MFSQFMQGLQSHLFIIMTISFTAYAQLAIKSQSDKMGETPQAIGEIAGYVFRVLTNPWIVSALAAALLGMFTWLLALRHFNLSYAYPFYSLIFIVVIFGSYFLFDEPLTWVKILGVVFIMIGIVLVGQSG